MVQKCTLLSIKTGGCSEDCSYCSQSSKYDTGLKAEKFMEEDDVMVAARKAKESGSTRFCMGAAWREPLGKKTNFKKVLHYIKEIRCGLPSFFFFFSSFFFLPSFSYHRNEMI
jgi:biotin synthase